MRYVFLEFEKITRRTRFDSKSNFLRCLFLKIQHTSNNWKQARLFNVLFRFCDFLFILVLVKLQLLSIPYSGLDTRLSFNY